MYAVTKYFRTIVYKKDEYEELVDDEDYEDDEHSEHDEVEDDERDEQVNDEREWIDLPDDYEEEVVKNVSLFNKAGFGNCMLIVIGYNVMFNAGAFIVFGLLKLFYNLA